MVGALGAAALTSGGEGSTWQMEPPVNPRRTGTFQHAVLNESSGVAVSRSHPGIIWTLNDSDNGPILFATDTLGRDHGAFTVAGARNIDWEAIALAPCGPRDCLYIADTGDNARERGTVQLYRLAEPPLPSASRRTATAEALTLRYPRGPRDVEALFIDDDGAAYLISKTRGSSARVYRVPASAWDGDEPVVAEDLGSLAIDSYGFGNMVTDAAISPAGNVVAVRTYGAIYLFRLGPGGRLLPVGTACDGSGLQLLGEGISWLDERVLVLTSEATFATPGTLILLECDGDSS